MASVEPSEFKPLDPKLFELVCPAVKKALDIIRKHVEAGDHIARYRHFPELHYEENGMPRFSEAYEGPFDYNEVFTNWSWLFGGEPELKVEDEPEFKAVKAHIRNSSNLWRHTVSATVLEEAQDSVLDNETKLFITSLADRYMHIRKTAEFSDSNLIPLYLPMEAKYLLEELPVTVWVPIMLMRFPMDEFVINETISIRRMSDEMHLARAGERIKDLGMDELAMAAATHAFVLKEYKVKNSERSTWHNEFRSNAHVLPTVELLFSMLRVATEIDTGYAQLLDEPIGWVSQYRADLLPLIETQVSKYPAKLKNWYWSQEDIPEINEESLETLARLFRQVEALGDNKSKRRILFAAKRLNECLLREEETDAVLDAVSAMEMLLTPGDNSEITHKLSIRLAALSKLSDSKEPPYKVFKAMKYIYAHRSNLVHGNIEKLNKSREIRINDRETQPTAKIAVDYLRLVLRTLIEHPEYLESSRIDENLLLSSTV
jgi:hypothetical protein